VLNLIFANVEVPIDFSLSASFYKMLIESPEKQETYRDNEHMESLIFQVFLADYDYGNQKIFPASIWFTFLSQESIKMYTETAIHELT